MLGFVEKNIVTKRWSDAFTVFWLFFHEWYFLMPWWWRLRCFHLKQKWEYYPSPKSPKKYPLIYGPSNQGLGLFVSRRIKVHIMSNVFAGERWRSVGIVNEITSCIYSFRSSPSIPSSESAVLNSQWPALPSHTNTRTPQTHTKKTISRDLHLQFYITE